MKKLKLFYLKNQMFVANGIANFIGVFLATGLIHRAEPYPKEFFDNPGKAPDSSCMEEFEYKMLLPE